MNLYDSVRDFFRFPEKDTDPFAGELRKYLLSLPDSPYDKVVCERTVLDVLALDRDLLDFVKCFVRTGRIPEGEEELVCDPYFTMSEFLDGTGYSPIAAALFFQQYRSDREGALHFLLYHDSLTDPDLHETLPPPDPVP